MELTSALALTDEDGLPQDCLIASHALRTAAVQQPSTFSKGPAISPRLLKQAVSANAQPLPNTNFCLRAMRQASEVGLGKLSQGPRFELLPGSSTEQYAGSDEGGSERLASRWRFLSCRCHCKPDG